jgi:putative acyl-CoA dehydrogenase
MLSHAQPNEADARRTVAAMAQTLQAALLVMHAPPAVSDAFVASRLAEHHNGYGTLPPSADVRAVAARAWPA